MRFNDDFDDYEDFDIKDIKSISYLYELRHLTNIFGEDVVASELKCSVKRIRKLYNSNIHGSNDISFIRSKNESHFNNEYQKLLKEQDERDNKIMEAQQKNFELVQNLKYLRKNALGIGTNKLKRRLNKLATTSQIAKALRLAIETEDCNIRAKDSFGEYREKIYNTKKALIEQLIAICKENNYVFGKQTSDVKPTRYIIYFDLPNTEQISFHTDLSNPNDIPDYGKEWDRKENSTYPKLIKSVEINFPDISKEK